MLKTQFDFMNLLQRITVLAIDIMCNSIDFSLSHAILFFFVLSFVRRSLYLLIYKFVHQTRSIALGGIHTPDERYSSGTFGQTSKKSSITRSMSAHRFHRVLYPHLLVRWLTFIFLQ